MLIRSHASRRLLQHLPLRKVIPQLAGRTHSYAIVSAQQRRSDSTAPMAATRALSKDYTTLSNYQDIKEVSRHYELDVDFARNVIEGYAKV